jgi:hypothetical protein
MLRRGGGISRAQAAAQLNATRSGAGGRWCSYTHVGSAVAAVDTIYLYWLPEYFIPGPVTLLRTRCTTGGAGSSVKYALWRHDPVTGRPTGLPIAGQNTGLATDTTNTNQDLVVASLSIGSPFGVWFGSKYTGTLPQMICNTATGFMTSQIIWPVGNLPAAPRPGFQIADAYANNILAFDMTGQPLVGSAATIPAVGVEWA